MIPTPQTCNCTDTLLPYTTVFRCIISSTGRISSDRFGTGIVPPIALTNSAKLWDSLGPPFESRCPPLERVTPSLNESTRRPPRVTSIHPQSVKNFPRVSPWGLEDDLGIIRVHSISMSASLTER